MPSDPAPRPLVVVVAYHGADQLGQALAPLRGLDVLVVDNSASDRVQAVAARHGAQYLDTGGNLGFARAVNRGVARADGRDVVLVNPDAVVTADTVRRLVETLHGGERVAACAPVLVGADGTAQRVRWPFPTPLGAVVEALGAGRWTPDADGFLVGAVLALNADALAEVGGFDPRFFLYAEETDWQRRAVRAGWSVQVVDGLSATHVGGASSTDEQRRMIHFHAGTERYVRTWHGRTGWAIYRAAMVLGSAARGAVLSGERGNAARRRAQLFATGPVRREELVAGRRRSVVHVVLTDNFAGTERLVVTEAVELASRGWDVTVVGGEPGQMRRELGPDVRHLSASTVVAGLGQLARVGRVDVVHAHLTAAELAAVVTRPAHRAPVVATRHIAARRGATRAGGLLAPLVLRGLTTQISISGYVADSIGEVSTVIPNAVVSAEPVTAPRVRVVLVLQRLEPEKCTDVAIRAWAASELAADGWRLVVGGAGSEHAALVAQAAALGVGSSVDFLGWVADGAVLLRSAGVVLAPAPAEPFGLSVAEAMAHGVAVVAADGGAHREVLGNSGLFFPVGDAEAAGALLRTIASSATEAARRGAALRVRQQEQFVLGRHVDGLERVYGMPPA